MYIVSRNKYHPQCNNAISNCVWFINYTCPFAATIRSCMTCNLMLMLLFQGVLCCCCHNHCCDNNIMYISVVLVNTGSCTIRNEIFNMFTTKLFLNLWNILLHLLLLSMFLTRLYIEYSDVAVWVIVVICWCPLPIRYTQ